VPVHVRVDSLHRAAGTYENHLDICQYKPLKKWVVYKQNPEFDK